MEKLIIFHGQQVKIACDEKCDKAWGANNRPRVYPQISHSKIYGQNGTCIYPPDELLNVNIDNYAYCADQELGTAPVDPGTREGDCAKPTDPSGHGNKWCVRECERCRMSDADKQHLPAELIDFSKRVYNITL